MRCQSAVHKEKQIVFVEMQVKFRNNPKQVHAVHKQRVWFNEEDISILMNVSEKDFLSNIGSTDLGSCFVTSDVNKSLEN